MIEIEEKYKTEFKEILTDYTSVHDDIKKIENEMVNLKSRWEDLHIRLNNIRNHEKNIRIEIIDKYGHGELNIETWTWEPDL